MNTDEQTQASENIRDEAMSDYRTLLADLQKAINDGAARPVVIDDYLERIIQDPERRITIDLLLLLSDKS